MKLNRLFAYLMGCAAFAAAVLTYLDYVYMLGFPDGGITELGYAERRLAYIFIAISVLAGFCFVYLGVTARRKAAGKKLSIVIVLYFVSIIGIYLIDYYFRSHLMDGTGG